MAFRNRRTYQRQEITPLIHNITPLFLVFKVVNFVLLTVMIIYITVMSSMTGMTSGSASSGIVYNIVKGFFDTFNINVNAATFDNVFTITHSVLRKVMHMTEFAALTLCLIYTFEHIKNSIFISAALAVCYAGADEIHQVFVDGRVGVYTDVLIDSVGIVIVVIFMSILAKYVYTAKDKSLYVRTNGLIIK